MNFRVGPVLILKFFSILVIFRVGPVKRNTLYDLYSSWIPQDGTVIENSGMEAVSWYPTSLHLLDRVCLAAKRGAVQ